MNGLYYFACASPKAHHGYGHSWEACFHRVDEPLYRLRTDCEWCGTEQAACLDLQVGRKCCPDCDHRWYQEYRAHQTPDREQQELARMDEHADQGGKYADES